MHCRHCLASIAHGLSRWWWCNDCCSHCGTAWVAAAVDEQFASEALAGQDTKTDTTSDSTTRRISDSATMGSLSQLEPDGEKWPWPLLVSSKPFGALSIKQAWQEHRFESCNKGQLKSASRTTKSSYLARCQLLASPQGLLARIWSKQMPYLAQFCRRMLFLSLSAGSKKPHPCLRTSIFVDYRP